MNILETIVKNKSIELEKAKAEHSLEELQKLALEKIPTISRRKFSNIFQNANLAVIAEIKLKSPSKGMLTDKTHIEIANLYAKSDADAISILTDYKYFNGQLNYLADVREIAPQPIFRKDFIIDEYQVYETIIARADAFLLIATILTIEQLKNLIVLGKKLGLECLVEVHTQEDLEKALAADAEIIGINNRDLTKLTTDLETSAKLVSMIPKGKIIVSESGIETAEGVKFLKALGVNGILVGSSIVESSNPIGLIGKLKKA